MFPERPEGVIGELLRHKGNFKVTIGVSWKSLIMSAPSWKGEMMVGIIEVIRVANCSIFQNSLIV